MVAGRIETEDRRRFAAQFRDLVSVAGVDEFDGDDYPPLASVRPGGDEDNLVPDLEVLFPAGLYAIPKPADSDAEPIAHVVGGVRQGSVVIVLSDPRCWPTDAASGEVGLINADGVRLALKAAGIEMSHKVTVSGKVTADGYKAGSADGLSGIVSIPTPGGPATLTFVGGILTATGGTATIASLGS